MNEHSLARQAGYEPIGQVMGSSFCRMAYRGCYRGSQYQPTGKLVLLTRAQPANRARAVSRLKQEAVLLGADGVIGVSLENRIKHRTGRLVEIIAIGTAVRYTGGDARHRDEPFTSLLSGQDFWKLHANGFVPREIAFGVCSYYIHTGYQSSMVKGSRGFGRMSRELRAYSDGVQEARTSAMGRFADTVKRTEADGAVGVTVSWDAEEKDYEIRGVGYVDLLVHFAAVGTAITARTEAAVRRPSTVPFFDLKERASSKLSPTE